MTSRLSFSLPAAILLLASPALGADWNAAPPLSEPRLSAAAASLAGALHVVGGRGSLDLASHEGWAPGDAAWSAGPALPESRVGAAAVGTAEGLWLAGGVDPFGLPSPGVRRWDGVSGSWTTAPDLPEGRAFHGLASASGALVVAGGEGDFGMPLASAWRHVPGTSSWSAIAPLPTPRSGVAVVAFDGRVWVIGGAAPDPMATVEAWDPATGAWSAMPSLPAALWQPAAAVAAGRVWVMGGVGGTFTPTNQVFSAGADGAWRAETALPAAVAAASAAGLGDVVVVAGGQGEGGAPLATVWTMNAGGSPPPPPPPPTDDDTLFVALELSPTTLNRGSNGRWIGATLEAKGQAVADVVIASIELNDVPVDLAAGHSYADQDGDGDLELSVRFPREPIAIALANGDQWIAVSGETEGGDAVHGAAMLRIVGSDAKSRGAGRHVAVRVDGGRNRIAFTLEQSAEVTIDVLDAMGRTVERLDRATYAAGTHERQWPASGSVRSGVYFVRVRTDGMDETVRLAVAR